MSISKCPSLFRPGKIGNMELRNRSVMPAMGLSSTEGGYVNDLCIRHYVERAKGGMGLIITEVTCIDAPLGLNTANMLCAHNDSYIPGLKKLAAAVHAEGAKIVLQVSHTGRGAKREITGGQPVGPSPIAMPMMYIIGVERETPRELTIPEIEAIEDRYAQGALRAKKAGFDGVEIHATGYYMGVQFLSALSNQRTDIYGGNIENRFRFIENIINKIRKLCGEDFPILVKPSLLQGEGITFMDGQYIVKRLVELGVAAIEVMAGGTKVMPTDEDLPFTASYPTPMMPVAKMMRDYAYSIMGDQMKTMFIAGGDIRTAEHIEAALSSESCDFVFIGKSCIAEPHFVKLLEEGREAEIHPCIGCYICASDQLASGAHGWCSGNGAMANDSRYEIPATEKAKKIVIVGGGPAGIEAAKLLKRKGHEVTIVEKSDKLGGQIYHAMAPNNKTHFKPLIPYYYATVEANNIPVLYNTEATAESILAMEPDVVICATGVKPRKLPIKGIDLPNVLTGKEYLVGEREVTGKQVVVVGGGDVGCEVAEKLASEGHDVTILEMQSILAPGYTFGNRCCLMHQLHRYNVKQWLGTKIYSVHEDHIVAEDLVGFRFDIACENVVMCTGDQANDDLYKDLWGKIPEIYNLGDSSGPASLAKAHADAFALAKKI